MDSAYRWRGRLHQETEYRLELTTTAPLYPTLEQAIRAAHPYELPDIHAIALAAVYAPYARWLKESCAGEAAQAQRGSVPAGRGSSRDAARAPRRRSR